LLSELGTEVKIYLQSGNHITDKDNPSVLVIRPIGTDIFYFFLPIREVWTRAYNTIKKMRDKYNKGEVQREKVVLKKGATEGFQKFPYVDDAITPEKIEQYVMKKKRESDVKGFALGIYNLKVDDPGWHMGNSTYFLFPGTPYKNEVVGFWNVAYNGNEFHDFAKKYGLKKAKRIIIRLGAYMFIYSPDFQISSRNSINRWEIKTSIQSLNINRLVIVIFLQTILHNLIQLIRVFISHCIFNLN